MKQKTRYNVRLAEKKGVIVSLIKSPNFAELYRLYAETATRDGFVIRDEAYYHTVWETFLQARGSGTQPSGDLLAAYVNGEIVAAILVFYFAQRAYYMYGMSRAMHREKMPSHALQWAAIKRARARGCVIYDLWGAPDVLSESDPMWGVFRFKQGLGGDVVRTVGAWDYAPSPFWYALYTKIVPRLLDVTRALGRRRTKRLVDGASRMA
jgi:peptidoglycan pentaglycine glycine transferase (the first glycine)